MSVELSLKRSPCAYELAWQNRKRARGHHIGAAATVSMPGRLVGLSNSQQALTSNAEVEKAQLLRGSSGRTQRRPFRLSGDSSTPFAAYSAITLRKQSQTRRAGQPCRVRISAYTSGRGMESAATATGLRQRISRVAHPRLNLLTGDPRESFTYLFTEEALRMQEAAFETKLTFVRDGVTRRPARGSKRNTAGSATLRGS